jgi:predicted GTPase
MKAKKVIIMGAAGRDFHNFNVFFRDNNDYNLVCFTAEQIPDITGRKYPRELAGRLYPRGIPIYPERDLPKLIKKSKIDLVVLAYSDLSYSDVMRKASIVNAAGSDFILMGTESTMLKSRKPIISICAVRTGCGKSQTTRRISLILRELGYRVVIIRHPMPYGNLKKQTCQRFAEYGDLYRHKCTIEEREEYEQHIKNGFVVYAGVDYLKILNEAEKEADVIIWDGGNNDTPFYKPDLHIVVADPHRPGHGIRYYPGETNLRLADVVVINKENTSGREAINMVMENVKKTNPRVKTIHANSVVRAGEPELIRNKRVLVIEDGPTLTHGEMSYGAGWVAAKKYRAKEIVDAEKYAVGSIREVYKKYEQLKKILPALGYGREQVRELEKTINRAPCDSVVIATPIDLAELIKIKKPSVHITYDLKEKGKPNLDDVIKEFTRKLKLNIQEKL